MSNPTNCHDRFPETARDGSRALQRDTCVHFLIIRRATLRFGGFFPVTLYPIALLTFVILRGVFFPFPAEAYEWPSAAKASPDASSTHQQNPNPGQPDAKALEAAINHAVQLVAEAQRLIDADNLDQGESKVRQAIVAYDRLPSTDALAIFGRANCYALLGGVANKRGDAQTALKLWQQAVSLYERLTGKSAVGNLVETLKLMAQLLTKMGQMDDALTVARKIDNTQEGADAAVRASNKSNIGVMLQRLGRQREAEQQLQQAVILSGLGDSRAEDKARYLYNLGLTEVELHDTRLAIDLYRQSLRFLEGLSDQEEPRAETSALLAQELINAGDRDEALSRLNLALDAIKDKPELRELKAKILNVRSRAMPDDTQAQKGAIVKVLQEALSLVEGREGTETTQVACIVNLGSRLQQMGNLEEAIRTYRQELGRLNEKPSNPTSEQLAGLYDNLGVFLLESGRASEALDSFLMSLGNAWQGMSARLPAMTQRDTLYAASNVVSRGNIIYSVALTSPRTMAPRAYEALLQTKALYSEANRTREQRLFHAGAPKVAAARERYVELRRRISRRTLDQAHTEVAASNQDMAQMASDIGGLEHDLLAASRELPEDFTLKPVHASQISSQLRPNEVLVEYFRYSSLDLKTRKETSSRYGAFVVHAGGAIEAVDLGEEAAVVNAIEAFRDCESGQVANAAFNENELAKFGESVRRLILDPLLPSRDSLKRVYVAPDGVLGAFPFDALPTGKGPGGWRYLAEDVEVVNLISGRELTRTASSRSPSSEVWLLGDPDFNATPDQRIAAFNDPSRRESMQLAGKAASAAKQGSILMGELPDSEDASADIPANWQEMHDTRQIVITAAEQASKAGLKTQFLLGADASEESLSRVLSPRLLMLATHGYFMKRDPGSYVSLSVRYDRGGDDSLPVLISRDQAEHGEKVNGLIYDNPDLWHTMDPLHRSMMILAGANQRVHHVVRYLVNGQLLSPDQDSKLPPVGREFEREIGDGLLTAYEVLGMNLTGTDLVVLAGCESGLGVSVDSKNASGWVPESESVVGLRQAFTMAGARSVVTSMWMIPLDETVQQMSAFLNAWLSRGRPRYQAFHESQLNALHAARKRGLGGHPFWWAGFIYFGDPGDR